MTTNTTAIGDHAAIGDCRSVALVGKDGVIDWLCWPNFSSPAVFAALLDPNGGHFRVGPAGPAQCRRRYLPDTNVLETLFSDGRGRCRLVDFMPVPPATAELRPARELVRMVECLDGSFDLEVCFRPRPDFGRASARLHRHGAVGWSLSWRGNALWLHGDAGLEAVEGGRALGGRVHLEAGERRVFWLTHAAGEMGVFPPLAECAERLESTIGFWRAWIGNSVYHGDYREAVRRSLLALKLLTYAPSGAVVAAATTSLPEAAGADRNWDYRYCWLRDSSLTFRALNDAGFVREAERFLRWLILATRLSAPRLNVVYDVYGRTGLAEIALAGLAGWRDSRPVRVGNDAHRQFQLDLYGEAMATVADFVDHGGRLTPQERYLLGGWGKTVCELWRQPDQGIWEVRTHPRHFTFSKAMAWVALDCLARLMEQGHAGDRSGSLDALRCGQARIAREIETRGAGPQGYVAAFDEDAIDASLLLLPWFGYADARQPRMRATVDRVLAELGHGPLVKRYRTGFDGFESEEGAFTACGFWAVDCLARAGEVGQAHDRFRQLLGYGNDLGLHAEEIDVDTGEQLGNFPQAFSHIALINAAMTLADVGREARA